MKALDSINGSGLIVGKVEFRQGEGIMLEIPLGMVEIVTTRVDATLSWTGGSNLSPAAIPYAEFCRYVAAGAIALQLRS